MLVQESPVDVGKCTPLEDQHWCHLQCLPLYKTVWGGIIDITSPLRAAADSHDKQKSMYDIITVYT